MAWDLMDKRFDRRDWNVSIGDDESGATLLWASAKGQLESLKVAVDVLNTDVSIWYKKSAKEDEQKKFANAWSMWRDQFYKWYKAAMTRWMTLAPETPWSVADMVEKKTAELNEWRKQFERQSGEVASGPGQIVPEGGSGVWKWVSVAGLSGFVALLIANKMRNG